MGSISVGELITCLERYDKDNEVIMYIRSRNKDGNKEEFIAYINGIGKENEDDREIRLMN